MKLIIIIEGESAKDLFAVGPNDLRDHFLPNDLGVRKEDIKSIRFEEVVERDEYGFPAKTLVNKENF